MVMPSEFETNCNNWLAYFKGYSRQADFAAFNAMVKQAEEIEKKKNRKYIEILKYAKSFLRAAKVFFQTVTLSKTYSELDFNAYYLLAFCESYKNSDQDAAVIKRIIELKQYHHFIARLNFYKKRNNPETESVRVNELEKLKKIADDWQQIIFNNPHDSNATQTTVKEQQVVKDNVLEANLAPEKSVDKNSNENVVTRKKTSWLHRFASSFKKLSIVKKVCIVIGIALIGIGIAICTGGISLPLYAGGVFTGVGALYAGVPVCSAIIKTESVGSGESCQSPTQKKVNIHKSLGATHAHVSDISEKNMGQPVVENSDKRDQDVSSGKVCNPSNVTHHGKRL